MVPASLIPRGGNRLRESTPLLTKSWDEHTRSKYEVLIMSYRLAKAALHSAAKGTAQHVLATMADAVYDKKVNDNDKKTLRATCNASKSYLAATAGYSVNTISRALKELQTLGLIAYDPKRKVASSYDLIIPIPEVDQNGQHDGNRVDQNGEPTSGEVDQNGGVVGQNGEHNRVLNKEEKKETKQKVIDYRQDNINIGHPQAEQPTDVLSVVNNPLHDSFASSSFSGEDAYDLLVNLDNPFPDDGDVVLVQEAGCRLCNGEKSKDKEPMSKAVARLRLSKTCLDAFDVIKSADKSKITAYHKWSVGTLVHKARDYTGADLNGEEMLKLLVAHYTMVFKDYPTEAVQKAVLAETPARTAVEKVAANGWRYTSGKVINNPIEWSRKVYEDSNMLLMVRVASGEDVPVEDVPDDENPFL